jgi:monoamine oxidase
MTGDLNDVSLLHLLALVRGHGSINTLFSIEGGAQENMVEGGAGEIARRVAAALGDAVHLDSPVTSITDAGDRVVVESKRVVVSARHVIVAVPPALTLEIDFDPALPRIGSRCTAIRWPARSRRRWSSTTSRSGAATASAGRPRSPIRSPRSRWMRRRLRAVRGDRRLRVLARRRTCGCDARVRTAQALLDALAARLGPRAARPAEVIETPWWKEVWTRGCSMAHLTPGTLTKYGHLIREPFGRVHWAGTETSTISHGAIDGAVRSGERAAAEILNRL